MHLPLAIECGDPGVPQNGSRQLSGRTAGSSVAYRCDSGFELVGAQTLRCMDSGEWSDRLPQCRGTVIESKFVYHIFYITSRYCTNLS